VHVSSSVCSLCPSLYARSLSPDVVSDKDVYKRWVCWPSADSPGCCLFSLIPLALTSHPSLSPPPRKAEGKASSSSSSSSSSTGGGGGTGGPAELPPEYLTSPLSQQSQVVVQETVSEAMATQGGGVAQLDEVKELVRVLLRDVVDCIAS